MNIISGLIVLRHVYMIHVIAIAGAACGLLTSNTRNNEIKNMEARAERHELLFYWLYIPRILPCGLVK